jgi:formylglycine-generating enzyme required for sulfatase activity
VAFCASAKRYGAPADAAFPVYGFRVVLAPFEEGSPRQGDDLAFIPPGTFTMGDPTEVPQVGQPLIAPPHQVRISRAFHIGRTELTAGQYLTITSTAPPANSNDWLYPVHSVSWDNAKNYCVLISALRAAESRLPIGYNYRLPTEAEWEYACRGGTNTYFYFGDIPACEDFNHDFCVGDVGAITPVGTYSAYRPHPRGLSDVHGNVMEWCLDSSNETTSYVDPSQPPQLRTDPTGPSGTSTTPRSKKVFRGGCWIAVSTNCQSGTHRVAPRDWFGPGGATGGTGSGLPNNEIGFRVALAPRVAWE